MARGTYDAHAIEGKWQARWAEEGPFRALSPGEPGFDPARPRYYVLIEFPYPSGEGLHVGHPRSYTALDVVARKRRMEGHNVLYPIGWDAFGLPTENYAIKIGVHPREVTEKNIVNFRRQLKRLGFSFDWSREVDTTDPAYYKWTQWIFLKLFEKGLAYKSEMPVNWCTACKVGLANEEVVGGVCERCGGEVVRRVRSQWMLKITEYAERLLADLDGLDFLERIKTQQRNWIGRSEGADVDFALAEAAADKARAAGETDTLTVFTTRPDTLYGATYMVLAPEHPLVPVITTDAQRAEVDRYVAEAAGKSDLTRTDLAKEKSGVDTGAFAMNPVNGASIPIWIADYVLISYGTGAIMAVPAHDTRDFEFAKTFGLPITCVVKPTPEAVKAEHPDDATDAAEMVGEVEAGARCFSGDGVAVNSDKYNTLSTADFKKALVRDFEGIRAAVNYKLRDWLFSRQRYWGEPIPVVECPECGWVPLPESELPLVLPEVERFQTTDTGESPLALVADWIETTCPTCGGPARRETDTMPQWAGSSWYFLRYADPKNDRALASREALEYWIPVDWYNGGMEHTTLHLLYSRFWHKFLFDIGVVPTDEPYTKRTSHGLVLGENGEKMSKSRGNVVNPDEMVDRFGADAFRLYELFMGAFELAIPWSTQGLNGMHRFLCRVWELAGKVAPGAKAENDLDRLIHKTVKKVGGDIEAMKFNTALAALMILANRLGRCAAIRPEDFERFVLLLAPFAPHMSEELWERLGHTDLVARAEWPAYDEALLVEEEVTLAVQVNGKVRSRVTVPADADEAAVREAALADEKVAKYVTGREVKKVVVVPGRLVNIVVK